MLLDLDWRGEGAIEVSEMRKHEVVTTREMSSLFCSNKLIFVSCTDHHHHGMVERAGSWKLKYPG